jgi:hypothetical protein
MLYHKARQVKDKKVANPPQDVSVLQIFLVFYRVLGDAGRTVGTIPSS